MRRIALPLLGLALVAAACGDDDAATTTAAATTTETTTAVTTTTGTGEGGTDMTADPGDTVAVHYNGTLDDGTPFDSSEGRDPLTFTIGSGQVIAGFDDAVSGMQVGDTTTVRIPAEDAYGPYVEDAVIEVPVTDLPEGVSVGDRLQAGDGSIVAVTGIEDEVATLDLNHPLAGEALTFEITLVSVG